MIRIAQEEHDDQVLSDDPFAGLVGMLLDTRRDTGTLGLLGCRGFRSTSSYRLGGASVGPVLTSTAEPGVLAWQGS